MTIVSAHTSLAGAGSVHCRQFRGVQPMQTELAVRVVHEGGMRVRPSDRLFSMQIDYPLEGVEALTGPRH